MTITRNSQIGDRVFDTKQGCSGTITEKKQSFGSDTIVFRIRWDNRYRDDSFRSA